MATFSRDKGGWNGMAIGRKDDIFLKVNKPSDFNNKLPNPGWYRASLSCWLLRISPLLLWCTVSESSYGIVLLTESFHTFWVVHLEWRSSGISSLSNKNRFNINLRNSILPSYLVCWSKHVPLGEKKNHCPDLYFPKDHVSGSTK